MHIDINTDEVRNLIAAGATHAQVAAAVGVGLRTFTRRLAETPELREAVAAGKRRKISVVQDVLVQKAEAGYFPAVRMLLLRNAGWLEGGYGIQGSAGMSRDLNKAWARVSA